jgi:hypothetical protein
VIVLPVKVEFFDGRKWSIRRDRGLVKFFNGWSIRRDGGLVIDRIGTKGGFLIVIGFFDR